MPKAELFKSSFKGWIWKARVTNISGKSPTDFNRTSTSSLWSPSPFLALADFWSFLAKDMLPLLHVGLLHVTKSHMYTQGERKNETDLCKLVQTVPTYLGSVRSKAASVQAKVQNPKETHTHTDHDTHKFRVLYLTENKIHEHWVYKHTYFVIRVLKISCW